MVQRRLHMCPHTTLALTWSYFKTKCWPDIFFSSRSIFPCCRRQAEISQTRKKSARQDVRIFSGQLWTCAVSRQVSWPVTCCQVTDPKCRQMTLVPDRWMWRQRRYLGIGLPAPEQRGTDDRCGCGRTTATKVAGLSEMRRMWYQNRDWIDVRCQQTVVRVSSQEGRGWQSATDLRGLSLIWFDCRDQNWHVRTGTEFGRRRHRTVLLQLLRIKLHLVVRLPGLQFMVSVCVCVCVRAIHHITGITTIFSDHLWTAGSFAFFNIAKLSIFTNCYGCFKYPCSVFGTLSL